jgi:tetratricopeptide (TPR) repeat protein
MRPAQAQIMFVILLLALASPAFARHGKDQPQGAPPAPSSGESSSRNSSSVPAGQPPAPKADTGTYDPVSAQDDIDVGTFYLHKGDIDAAIARFEDAIRLRSNFAKPRLLLAEAYEKKGDKTSALKYYKEYLQVYPKAPDAKKIQSKIDKLSGG